MLRWFALMLIVAGSGMAQEKEIRAVLEKSAEDWTRGDVATFMQSYEDSSETTFVGKSVVKGTAAVLARYKTAYPDKEHMGNLKFSNIVVRPLTKELAIVTLNFNLERTAAGGGPAHGIVSLVMRKSASGWRIIHDHSAALP